MIEEMEVPLRLVLLAEQDAFEMGPLPHSMTKGERNVYGCLGERLVALRIGARLERTDDYDMVKDVIRVDAKTKAVNSIPRKDYECSIIYNTWQECDYYVFVRVMKDFSIAWCLGAIRKHEYFQKMIVRRKGEIDPSNGLVFLEDSYNLPISQLHPLQKRFENNLDYSKALW